MCDQCYKGVAAFRIHSLDVHGIADPELGKLQLIDKNIIIYKISVMYKYLQDCQIYKYYKSLLPTETSNS